MGVHEIRHTYYSIPGGQREAELLRILAFEEPERAVIFCNTRDETGRVAEYLRRQGMVAEPISSDLSQSEREKVMQRMRAGSIRFLVATDVAARGIDIENLPCVINYTFPESPEIYIHRTGRTGRAGRSGHAISLIGPTEVGSFYYLKLLYKIRPEERSLPSEAEVRSHREGERLVAPTRPPARRPGPEWHSLARRLMGAIDAERLIGSLLRGALAEAKPEAHNPAAAAPPGRDQRARSAAPKPRSPRFLKSADRVRRHEEAIASGERRPARASLASERGQRERPERERSRRGAPAQQRLARPALPARPTSAPARKEDGREFWEVWSEEVGRTPDAAEADDSGQCRRASPPVADPSRRQCNHRLGPSPPVRKPRAQGRRHAGDCCRDAFIERRRRAGAGRRADEHAQLRQRAKETAEKLVHGDGRQGYNGRAVACEPARPPRRTLSDSDCRRKARASGRAWFPRRGPVTPALSTGLAGGGRLFRGGACFA